eukprot:14798183-Alexandrium_andersonii.AAC.1
MSLLRAAAGVGDPKRSQYPERVPTGGQQETHTHTPTHANANAATTVATAACAAPEARRAAG